MGGSHIEEITHNVYCSAQGPDPGNGADHLVHINGGLVFLQVARGWREIGEPDEHGGRVMIPLCPVCGAELRRFKVPP